ncbi:MAG: ASPIC/UnbV domain-containing protein [Elusimicrobia bacterium]|nr:ASPIC/UnbV domain-containing protein [Elusimicrobiota bacterium]
MELKGRQGSGKDGFGAKVEVKAGELWVERELTGANGGSSQAPAPMLFGLGKRDKADLVRVTWPTGIRQSLVDVPAGQTVRVTEKRGRPATPSSRWSRRAEGPPDQVLASPGGPGALHHLDELRREKVRALHVQAPPVHEVLEPRIERVARERGVREDRPQGKGADHLPRDPRARRFSRVLN